MNGRLYLFATLLAVTLALSVNHQTTAANHDLALDNVVKQQISGKVYKFSGLAQNNLILEYATGKKAILTFALYEQSGRRLVVFLEKGNPVVKAMSFRKDDQYGFDEKGLLFVTRFSAKLRAAKLTQGTISQLLAQVNNLKDKVQKSFTTAYITFKYRIPVSPSELEPTALLRNL